MSLLAEELKTLALNGLERLSNLLAG